MAENLAIPPVPDDRAGKYEWITKVVALGFTVGAACKLAGVPRISYYKVGRKADKSVQIDEKPEEAGAA